MAACRYKAWEAEDKLEQIRRWVKDGLSDAQIAKQMGITKSLLSNWRRTRPRIRAALVRLTLIDGKHVDKHDIAPGGKRKLNNVQELKVKIDGWIAECKKTDTPMTKSGLCLCLDISKDTLNAYLHSTGADTTVYSKSEIDGELHPVSVPDLLKRAVLAIENSLERRMISGKGNVAGIIFDLKNNHGYADKSEVSTVNTNAKAVSDEDIDKRIAELMNKSDVFRRSS
jgi:hypothetical protein